MKLNDSLEMDKSLRSLQVNLAMWWNLAKNVFTLVSMKNSEITRYTAKCYLLLREGNKCGGYLFSTEKGWLFGGKCHQPKCFPLHRTPDPKNIYRK